MRSVFLKNVLKIAILMIMTTGISFGLVFALKAFGITGSWLTKCIPFAVIIIVTLIFSKITGKASFSELGLKPFADKIPASLALLCASGLPALISLVYDKTIESRKPFDINSLAYIPYYALVAFSEEFLFRGYIGKLLEKNRNIVKAAISALAFSSYHFISPEFNLVNFVLLFIFGMIFMYMYIYIKNLWPLMLFHFGWNVLGDYFSSYQNAVICMLSLVLILLAVMLVSRSRVKREEIIRTS